MADRFNLSDIFISYSRKDMQFAQALNKGLLTIGRETWIDWNDIPPTADWWEEIKAGIEAASIFVFVISPDSARSRVCFDEIEHAVQHGKRIIPILFRELEKEQQELLHPTVLSRNWIYMRKQDDKRIAFRNLVQDLETDFDYVRQHTRLTVLARDWETSERRASRLLRGDDLRRAEKWLTSSIGKEPLPTDLIITFIQESTIYRIRLRQIISVLGTLLIIMLSLLSLYAYSLTENMLTIETNITALAQTNAANVLNLEETQVQVELIQTQIAESQQAAATGVTLSSDELSATATSIISTPTSTPISTYLALVGTATESSLILADANLHLTEAAIQIDTLQTLSLSEPLDSPTDSVPEIIILQLITQLITVLIIALVGFVSYLMWQRRIKPVINQIAPPLDLSNIDDETIFISYSRRDYDEYVAPLVSKLRDAGYNVWIDQGQLQAGQRWLDEIEEALKICGRLILCLSPDALNSEYVKLEYEYFLFNKLLFPIMCKETELPPRLQPIQYTAYDDFEGLCKALDLYKPQAKTTK